MREVINQQQNKYMPQVGSKHFPYTKKGKAKAKKLDKKKGLKVMSKDEMHFKAGKEMMGRSDRSY